MKLGLSATEAKKNRPIPVWDVDNFGRLYCPEYTKKVLHFRISMADSSSLLNIIAKATCFPPHVRHLAAKIRDKVRPKSGCRMFA